MLRLHNSRPLPISRGPSLVLFTTCLGVLMAALDISVINLALPHIDGELHGGVSAMQWVVDAYNLCYASLILTGGTLGDLYGRRRMFVLGTALFLSGSLVCAWAPGALALGAIQGSGWGWGSQSSFHWTSFAARPSPPRAWSRAA